MAQEGAAVSVADDIGILRDALVQGPVCRPLGGAARAAETQVDDIASQHARLVEELEAAGVAVRHLDALVYSALGFADARDWLLERRIDECEGDDRRANEMTAWLSEQPADILTRYVMEGTPRSALPSGFGRFSYCAPDADSWFLPPLGDLIHPRGLVRFLDGGAIVCQPEPAASRAAAITISAVLNFAPLFDHSGFDIWLDAYGTDTSCPPISGHDIAMPGSMICVGAITQATSVQALSLLAASLFRQGKAETMFWIDLTGADCESLDDCFVPLGNECLLIDKKILEMASAFVVRANKRGAVLGIEPCKSGFPVELSKAFGSGEPCYIDVNRFDGPVGSALAAVAPIVLSPGQIMVFEHHEAAFSLLEQHGVKVASVVPGSALSRKGKGPRGLLTALRVEHCLSPATSSKEQ